MFVSRTVYSLKFKINSIAIMCLYCTCMYSCISLLSSAIEKAGFLSLLDGASTVDKARLLAISAPQAHAWLRAQPSRKLGLDLLPNEVQALVKWWLGLPVFTDADACPHCSQTLDIHGHHALICHAGGDVVTRHNCLRDSFADFCRRACLAPKL